MSFFEVIHKDNLTGARAGVIHTAHGDIETPCFMPVGTQGTVKTIDSGDLEKINAPIILGNTYHLHLRPGEEIITQAGGLHRFMNWPHPILTDSGGFQVFSLGAQKEKKHVIPSKAPACNRLRLKPMAGRNDLDFSATPKNNNQGALVKITDDGVEFRSHLDGSTHYFTPESAVESQQKIGADIIMAFDECTPDSADYEYTRAAMERTHRWALRCLKKHEELKNNQPINNSTNQHLFGIIQGAGHEDLRKKSAEFISSLNFDGIAVGGESIGYNMEATAKILDWVIPIIPADKPHYTMGVGLKPADLLTVVEHGADMFDCVAPTRLARHGMLFCHPEQSEGSKHRLNIKNTEFSRDFSPIDKNCSCPTCQNYTRAYLHHLFAADEITGLRLATIHNLYFMLDLMRQARQAILEDRFAKFTKPWRE